MMMLPDSFSLSLIIPAYNEEQRLPPTLSLCLDYLSQQAYPWEIIVVDDGSSDATLAVVATYKQTYPTQIKTVSYGANKGKGYAIKQGILSATHAYCLLYDADGAVPLPDLERFFPALLGNPKAIVIGSRNVSAPDIARTVRWYRKIIGRCFNSLLGRVTPGIADTQCGFKLLPTPYATVLATLQREEGFAFDVEYLHLSLRHGLKVVECAVNWHDVAGSKVHLIQDSWRMFLSVQRIGTRSARGEYGDL
jgi:dolichyl-phosphate beta-glucosyltransferase